MIFDIFFLAACFKLIINFFFVKYLYNSITYLAQDIFKLVNFLHKNYLSRKALKYIYIINSTITRFDKIKVVAK